MPLFPSKVIERLALMRLGQRKSTHFTAAKITHGDQASYAMSVRRGEFPYGV